MHLPSASSGGIGQVAGLRGDWSYTHDQSVSPVRSRGGGAERRDVSVPHLSISSDRRASLGFGGSGESGGKGARHAGEEEDDAPGLTVHQNVTNIFHGARAPRIVQRAGPHRLPLRRRTTVRSRRWGQAPPAAHSRRVGSR